MQNYPFLKLLLLLALTVLLHPSSRAQWSYIKAPAYGGDPSQVYVPLTRDSAGYSRQYHLLLSSFAGGSFQADTTTRNIFLTAPIFPVNDTTEGIYAATDGQDGYLTQLDHQHFSQSYNKYVVGGNYSSGTLTLTARDGTTWTIPGLPISGATQLGLLNDVHLVNPGADQALIDTGNGWTNKPITRITFSNLISTDVMVPDGAGGLKNAHSQTIDTTGASAGRTGVRYLSNMLTLWGGYKLATDAPLTITSARVVKLPAITASRVLTLPSGSYLGDQLQLINVNGAAFSWTLAGAGVVDTSGAAITSLTNHKTYDLLWDGTSWISKY